jgi:DNA (cytosine-5)-methyltransferase 1
VREVGGAGGEGLVRVLRALSLFSGIGGLDLAAEMAGIETAAFCEIEPFPVEVLTKRFPGVPIFEDVRKLTAEVIRDRTGMGTSQSIDIIFGGFPCQDLSHAGKQRGLEGERSGLWFEMNERIRRTMTNDDEQVRFMAINDLSKL